MLSRVALVKAFTRSGRDQAGGNSGRRSVPEDGWEFLMRPSTLRRQARTSGHAIAEANGYRGCKPLFIRCCQEQLRTPATKQINGLPSGRPFFLGGRQRVSAPCQANRAGVCPGRSVGRPTGPLKSAASVAGPCQRRRAVPPMAYLLPVQAVADVPPLYSDTSTPLRARWVRARSPPSGAKSRSGAKKWEDYRRAGGSARWRRRVQPLAVRG